MQWSTFGTPRDSDHTPLLISIIDGGMKRRNYSNVELKIFNTNIHFNDMPTNMKNATAEELIENFYGRLNGAIEEATSECVKKHFSKMLVER